MPVLGAVGSHFFGSPAEKPLPPAVAADIARISRALEAYQRAHGELPENLDALAPVELRELPRDPWGHPYQYLRLGQYFQLVSMGPDGLPKTVDDLSTGSWREKH